MGDSTQNARSPIRKWLILAVSACAALAFAAALGTLPTYRLAGIAGLQAMAAASIAVWLVCAAGAVPVAMARPSDGRGVLLAIQSGTAVRFLLILAVTLALVLGSSLPRVALLGWIAIDYMVALAITTVVELRLLRGKASEASA